MGKGDYALLKIILQLLYYAIVEWETVAPYMDESLRVFSKTQAPPDLKISLDKKLSPSSQNFVAGTTDNLIAVVDFSGSYIEKERVYEFTIVVNGSGSECLRNFSLYDYKGMPIGYCAKAINSSVNFVASKTDGLFDVWISEIKMVFIKADIFESDLSTSEFDISFNSASVKAFGLTTQNEAAVYGSFVGVTHSILPHGNLTVTVSGDSPASATFYKGTKNLVAKFNLAASDEDMTTHSVEVLLNGMTETGDIRWVDLYEGDNYIGTIDCPVNIGGMGKAVFFYEDVVTENTTKTLSVYAYISSYSSMPQISVGLKVEAAGVNSCSTEVVLGAPVGATHKIVDLE